MKPTSPTWGRIVEQAAQKTGLTSFLARAATGAVALCAKIELEIAQLKAATMRGRFSRTSVSPSRVSIA